MSTHRSTVETYFEGFRRSDHHAILALLTDDVTWDLPGHSSLRGKVEFDAEIENPAFDGSPELDVDRLVEDDDTVVATGVGKGSLAAGGEVRFAFCTLLTFRGELIERVESYVVPLG